MAVLKRERALEIALHTLRSAGVEGVMVDVWWGICERAGPRAYDFSAYRRLFHKCAAAGLRVQVGPSFGRICALLLARTGAGSKQLQLQLRAAGSWQSQPPCAVPQLLVQQRSARVRCSPCRAPGLFAQAVMSFHAAGGNVGDTCKIPLPKWVVDIGERNPDIFYTDKQMHRCGRGSGWRAPRARPAPSHTALGGCAAMCPYAALLPAPKRRLPPRNKECLSLGCDEVPLFWGRTPVDMYRDFIDAFADAFDYLFGACSLSARAGRLVCLA